MPLRLKKKRYFRLNANGRGIFSHFSNFAKCRPEAAGDVISGMALDYESTDIPASFGDSMLNSGRISPIRHFVWPDPICALLCSI